MRSSSSPPLYAVDPHPTSCHIDPRSHLMLCRSSPDFVLLILTPPHAIDRHPTSCHRGVHVHQNCEFCSSLVSPVGSVRGRLRFASLRGDTPSTAAPNYTCIVYCHGPSAHRNTDDYRGTCVPNTIIHHCRGTQRLAVRLAAGVFAGCAMVVVTWYLASNASFGLLQHFR